ncbi:PQQ-dependent sugar dehydrogenase [Aurantiacibacter poecillastricola]|uniref:PQQ-dependent sugar dehydrogenase n=1 Tax=Aurantiacibacter poecillastricola TaxID=3064385 RepID=UPI00273E9BE0|nr:PQQ-dependent sugar dehydrogenase [Aurantiacibacter sp. 219JJ12-13]MDP5261676.1 PQQ-dependent sugar dehydrogenase [Aurantiacibacter sp. 219JJ12-13]
MVMRLGRAAAMAAFLSVAAVSFGQAQAQDDPPARPSFAGESLGAGPWDFHSEHGPLHLEVVVQLERPWGMAFLPEGGMLVTERVGRLRHIAADGTLDPRPIAGLPAMYTLGIAGLKGIALHPDFAENRLVYMAYSKVDPEDETNSTLAVMRGRWEAGADTLTDVEDIFVADTWYGAMPLPDRCCGQGPAFGSYGGRILFDPDGYLFVTSGDRNWGERVQDPASQYGKIFRMTDEGEVPPGNPWVGLEGHEPLTWSTGHRNPLGLTYNTATGEIWESEFGPRGGDEVNRILRGGNYGWMPVTQGMHYDGTQAEALRNAPGMIDPVLVYGPPSFNPGNLAFYNAEAIPEWQGDLLLGSFTQGLLRYDTDNTGAPIGEPERLLRDLGQRWRDVQVGPDGAVYLLTDQVEGALLKLTAGTD